MQLAGRKLELLGTKEESRESHQKEPSDQTRSHRKEIGDSIGKDVSLYFIDWGSGPETLHCPAAVTAVTPWASAGPVPSSRPWPHSQLRGGD